MRKLRVSMLGASGVCAFIAAGFADGEALLTGLGFDARIRGEVLRPEEMAKLSDALLDMLRANSAAK